MKFSTLLLSTVASSIAVAEQVPAFEGIFPYVSARTALRGNSADAAQPAAQAATPTYPLADATLTPDERESSSAPVATTEEEKPAGEVVNVYVYPDAVFYDAYPEWESVHDDDTDDLSSESSHADDADQSAAAEDDKKEDEDHTEGAAARRLQPGRGWGGGRGGWGGGPGWGRGPGGRGGWGGPGGRGPGGWGGPGGGWGGPGYGRGPYGGGPGYGRGPSVTFNLGGPRW